MPLVRSAVAVGLVALIGAVVAQPVRAQYAPGAAAVAEAAAVAQWTALPVPPGGERAAMDIIAASMSTRESGSGWARDASGNLVIRRGSGSPRRVVACGLDEAGYVVSEITADGYVRLQSSGRARRSALWDQFHEGQRVRILTGQGARAAVVAVRSTHLWRTTRGTAEPIVRVEDLWVDVGARSRTEAVALGIRVLDPVLREWLPWTFADVVSGPAAAARAGCAAVAGTSSVAPAAGETIWVLSAQHAFGYVGLLGALSRTGPVDSLFLVDPVLTRDTAAQVTPADPVTRRAVDGPAARVFAGRAGSVVAIGVRSRYPGTLVETVQGADILALVADVARAAGVSADTGRASSPRSSPVVLTGVAGPPPPSLRVDSLTPVAQLMAQLSDLYSVSGREEAVRTAVTAALPAAWRKQPSRVDTAGDLIVEAGPDRDTVVAVAHMDEIGYGVSRIDHDGTITLAQLGGFYSSLWEGQPALLHLDEAGRAPAQRTSCPFLTATTAPTAGVPPGALRGIFIPRARAASKEPDTARAWFGVDSAGLAACGVVAGGRSRVSGYKLASRLGVTRFTARAIDDRAGCTALLLALATIDPARLTHKVIFVWSVREEIGLEGAAAVAAELRTSVRRVHAVDTFVSSDSPLESPRFAYAPLGGGAALRALDNSSVTPPREVARALAIAAAARIPVQAGTTNGGNDGSVFVPWGAVDVAVGWPLRYSHSPAELVDLRDIRSLGRWVAALVVADQAR